MAEPVSYTHLIDAEIYKDWESITSLELKGRLNDTDLNLLKNMMTAGKGYNLKTLDMTEVENETLKNGVFNGCNLLENISFPTGLQYVPREACRNCTKLRTVVVNEGPTYIGRHAFGNSVVNEAWFPSTMTYVYGYIFDNVTALKTLHLKSLPFQCKEVARSDADEGATQPTTWCTVFKTWPSLSLIHILWTEERTSVSLIMIRKPMLTIPFWVGWIRQSMSSTNHPLIRF